MKLPKFAMVLAVAFSSGASHALDCPILQTLPQAQDKPIPDWKTKEAALMKAWTANYDFYIQIVSIRDKYGATLKKNTDITYAFSDGRTAARPTVTSKVLETVKLNQDVQAVKIEKVRIPPEAMHIEGPGIFMRVGIYAPQSRFFHTYETSAEIPLDGRLSEVKEKRLQKQDWPLPADLATNSNEFIAVVGADANNYTGDQYSDYPNGPATILAITRMPKNPDTVRKLADMYRVGQEISLVGTGGQVFRINGINRDSGMLQIKSVQKTGNMFTWAHVLQVDTVMGQNIDPQNTFKPGDLVIQVNDTAQVTSAIGTVTATGGNLVEVRGFDYVTTYDSLRPVTPVKTVCGVGVGDRVQLAPAFFASQQDFSTDSDSSDASQATRKPYVNARIQEASKCVATVKALDSSGFANLNWDKSSCDFRAFSQYDDQADIDRLNWIHLTALNRAKSN